jgi:AraC-like DNA-binding protein
LLHTYTKLKKNNQQLFKKYKQEVEIYNTYYAQREWHKERIKELERKVEEMNQQLYGVSPSKLKYEHSTLEEENKQRLLNKILDVMYNNEEIYSHEFSLQRLSELVGAPYKHVSQVINEIYKINFNNMLNEFRVREACRRLAEDENYTNYTIEAIAESIGFKSRSNFISTFKKLTGITPSEYKRIATKQQ